MPMVSYASRFAAFVIASALSTSALAAAPDPSFELEFGIAGGTQFSSPPLLGPAVGVGGLGTGSLGGVIGGVALSSGFALAPLLRVGFVASDRAVVTLAISGRISDNDWEENAARTVAAATRTRSITIPIGLKLYLNKPAKKKVLPMVRLGLGYDYAKVRYASSLGAQDSTSHGLALTAGVGVQYLFTESLGIVAELTGSYLRAKTNSEMTATSDSEPPPSSVSSTTSTLGAGFEAALVLRF